MTARLRMSLSHRRNSPKADGRPTTPGATYKSHPTLAYLTNRPISRSAYSMKPEWHVSSSSSYSAPLYFTERGSGPPLLLVHGLMITGEMFEPIIDQFAARHRVIVPDLRGHGRSRALPPPYTVSQVASDLSLLLVRLRVDSATVLGYSHGGAIAQQLVLDHPTNAAAWYSHVPTPSTGPLFASGSKATSHHFSSTCWA
jgi:pimeloyl-ACP methyl ester carboxylesterase